MRVVIGLITFVMSCWIYSMLVPTLGWGWTVLLWFVMQLLGGAYAYLTVQEGMLGVVTSTLNAVHELSDEEWKKYGEESHADERPDPRT